MDGGLEACTADAMYSGIALVSMHMRQHTSPVLPCKTHKAKAIHLVSFQYENQEKVSFLIILQKTVLNMKSKTTIKACKMSIRQWSCRSWKG